jgi:ribosomal protein S3
MARGLEGAESTQKNVSIPSAAVGAVIGKEGSTIADLQSKTGCIIKVYV